MRSGLPRLIATRYAATSTQPVVGEFAQGGGQGGEDQRRGAVADRHLQHLRLPEPALGAELAGQGSAASRSAR